MDSRQSAQNSGLRRAFEARNRLSIARTEPLNVFDACQKTGIDVRFVDATSLEGMYCRAPRLVIFVPSSMHRPWGRIAFSCAHELGHHELGHGTRADKYVAGTQYGHFSDPEELAADVFAAHFLMPRQAIVHAFRVRNWEISTLLPEQAYVLAGLFGVGYRTFLWQLAVGLQVLPEPEFQRLKKATPKSIRQGAVAASAQSRLLIIDADWQSTTADLEVSDYVMTEHEVMLPEPMFENAGSKAGHSIWIAKNVGHGHFHQRNRKITIRVSRKGYVGAWRHRFTADAIE